MLDNDMQPRLHIIKELDIPVDLARPTDVVLSHYVTKYRALLYVGNPAGYMMGIGKRGVLKFYDLDKLRADGVYIHRRNYGGSGALFGRKDIIWSLHISKLICADKFQVSAAELYKYFNLAIYDVMRDLGIEVEVDTSERSQAEDGACIHLQGRSEIVTLDGRKVAVSVFKEDDIGIYINGAILISDAWARIYQYLTSPVRKELPNNSVEKLLSKQGITGEVMDKLIRQMAARFHGTAWETLDWDQSDAIHGIKDKYRIQ